MNASTRTIWYCEKKFTSLFIAMKKIVIWDIHWRDIWKDIVKENADEYIIMWDYFDSFTIDRKKQWDNFLELIDFKKKKKKKCILLIWNHDFHYFINKWEIYSWFDFNFFLQYWTEIESLLMRYWTFKHIDEHFTYTHAWISDTRLSEWGWEYPNTLRFNNNDYSFSWNHKSQWPLRIRPMALLSDTSTPQVVWHTQMWMKYEWWVWFVDSLEYWEYLTIIDGIWEISKIKQ